jgi:plastocyanin
MKKIIELSLSRFVMLSFATALSICLCSCADKPVPLAQTDPVKVEPTKTAVKKAQPIKVKPVNTAVVKAPAIKVEPVKVVPAKATNIKVQPIVETVKTQPVKAEPVKAEPVKAEPQKIIEPTKAIQAAVVVPAVAMPPVVASTPTPVAVVRGSIKGTVTILGKNSEPLSAGEVIVTLEPLFPVSAVSKQQKTYEIAMVDKKYTPGVITIKPGDTVKFNNKDSIKHNVFSSSGNNAFELGTYGFGVAEGATLKYPGIVKVYCNIHAGMAAFVSVSESGYSFITKDNGQFVFNELPVGAYRVKVWHVRGEAEKSVQVIANQSALGDIVINSAAYVPETHMNKYGKPYKKIPTLFKDEFY